MNEFVVIMSVHGVLSPQIISELTPRSGIFLVWKLTRPVDMQCPRTPPMSAQRLVHPEVLLQALDDKPDPIISTVSLIPGKGNTFDQYEATSENASRSGRGMGFGSDSTDPDCSWHVNTRLSTGRYSA